MEREQNEQGNDGGSWYFGIDLRGKCRRPIGTVPARDLPELQDALRTGDRSYEHFKPYETKLKAGVKAWYEFIRLYYKLMHLFPHFTVNKEYRYDLLALIQGEVYDRDRAKILDEMRKVIKTVEATPNHMWKSVLTDIPID